VENPVLFKGEPGYEDDTRKLKIGDGENHWLDLEYIEGSTGPAGADGDAGAAGAAGPPGFGVEGEEGEWFPIPGASGATGSAGSQGDPGATGATGPAGQGAPGFDGEDAENLLIPGSAGAAGTPGTTGPQGPPGLPGFDGEDSENLIISGQPGAAGAAGSAGATGPQGPAIGLIAEDGEDAPIERIPGAPGAAGTPATLTQSYVGYNTVGGSTEVMTDQRVLAKKITLATAGLLTNIEVHVDGGNSSDEVESINFGLYADSGGTPSALLSMYNGREVALLMDNTLGAGGNTVARWFGGPMGVWLAAGDYWLAVQAIDTGASMPYRVYYDGSGTDRYYDSGGNWLGDWGWYSPTTGSNTYSIRGNIVR
jgi:hypothetical protein